MAESYLREKMAGTATFNLCIREYPPNRSYFVSAGLNEVLSYIEAFRFTKDDIDYLESVQLFSKKFLRYLESLRFTGDVNAISKGRIFFRNEPIIEVTAPIIKTQIVETFLINTLNLNITLASKAARSFAGRRVEDSLIFLFEERKEWMLASWRHAQAIFPASLRQATFLQANYTISR